jgi:hypothetical protein
MRCATTIFDAPVPKVSIDAGTGASMAIRFEGQTPVSYAVQTDSDETASAVINASIYSRSADGEVPQLQCAVSSQGGGDIGSTIVAPGIEVTVNLTTSGADVPVGITGSSNIPV